MTSNDTKRDVFLESADKCAGYNDELYNQYMQRYDAALPDDLPVISKEIDEYIRWCKGEGGVGNVSDAMDYAHGDVASWIYDERNSDIFARAWLDGYVVEEEK